MNKFLRTEEIIIELRNIIEEAKKELILVSPFIKFDNNYKNYFSRIMKTTDLKIIVVYGKNENDQEKSLNNDDVKFLKDFSNIEIRYMKNLHGKYYANENRAIITSMNFYGYSKDNREFGILLNESNKNDLFLETKNKYC